MGDSSHNWFPDMEIQDGDLFNKRYKMDPLINAEDEMFRQIMHRSSFSRDYEGHSQNITASVNHANNLVMKSNGSSNNFTFPQLAPQILGNPAAPTSPTAYILSFSDSTVVSAAPETYTGKEPCNDKFAAGAALPPLESRTNKTGRKGRSSAETLDHIMAERKRRRELTERFIALSATIPGLKKIDKASILSEAIKHVKRLKERVRELEEERKKTSVESVSLIIQKKSEFVGIRKGSTTSGTEESLPTVEARVFKKDILLRIHCKIGNGILLRILEHLKALHLSTTTNTVLPFGNSTLDITIVAQMGEKFNVTMNDLVKNLRGVLLQPFEEQQ